MKRWLTALFVWLMMTSFAQAEELPADADWLTGVWRFDGGGEVGGYGFRLDADGTYVSLGTDDWVSVPPERLFPLAGEGAWRYADGLLTFTHENGAQTYPVQVYPQRDGCDVIHLSEGGGGGFYRRGDESALVRLAAPIPADIMLHLEAFHPDYRLIGYAEMADSPMGRLGFSLIECKCGRMLHGFRWTEGEWDNFLDTAEAIPQGAHANVRLYISPENPGYSQLWYREELHDFAAPQGPVVTVETDNGEYVEERVAYLITAGGLSLLSYGDGPNCQIDVVGDELVFYNISYGYEGSAVYPRPLDIPWVEFAFLPRAVQEVRITGTGEPALPGPDVYSPYKAWRQEWDNYLQKQDVALRAGKYPVYAGPGRQFGRAANGKAAVSTNGWVQVFGEYDGWLLIHYAVSAEQYRFGWIEDSALEKGETVAALPLSFGDVMNSEEPIDLMDDPLNSRAGLLSLTRDTVIERLAQLGDGYSLVRVWVDGKESWGFVFSWPLGHG